MQSRYPKYYNTRIQEWRNRSPSPKTYRRDPESNLQHKIPNPEAGGFVGRYRPPRMTWKPIRPLSTGSCIHRACASGPMQPLGSKYAMIIYSPKTCTTITRTKTQVSKYWKRRPSGLLWDGNAYWQAELSVTCTYLTGAENKGICHVGILFP